MSPALKPCVLIVALAFALTAPPALAQTLRETRLPRVEVTTHKLPESIDVSPAMISVVTGDDMRARGVVDLRTALALVAGVEISPGGDAGPAGSVPGLWGLKEFDAFLLVVDGVPYGGAFNPALTTLDLNNVARIEVLRGAAPVVYGATSFVGVIHVIHYAPGETPSRATVAGGTRNTARAAISTDLPDLGVFKQSISANAETNQFSQDRSQVDRVHLLYRNAAELDFGRLHFDVDATALDQDPYSPHPREGSRLTVRVPLDANHNPRDARQDETRVQFTAGLDVPVAIGEWVTTLSVARTNGDNIRGFLREDFADDGITVNADGFRQQVRKTDAYFDTFLSTRPSDTLNLTLGLDWLYGRGTQESDNFEYAVLPDGSNAPNSSGLPIDESTELTDRRSFGGVYAQADWQPVPRLDIVAGVRFNRTHETRDGRAVDLHAPAGSSPEQTSDTRNKSRISGVVGASYALWEDGADRFTVFADYRNAYKPAAVDFGPEAEGDILEPETAHSSEFGFKGRLLQGRFEWEASYFHMNFANLVIRENIGGLPALANAGTERFKGAEIEASYLINDVLRVAGSWAYHDARFVDFARLRPNGSIQQLGGNRLELSPQNL
ncbi:MAG: TonB-dependent receptor, partial [Lysobacterales bacterium]